MIDPRLDGKTVLITGANHGIGAAAAATFAAQGAAVFVTFLRGPAPDRVAGDLETPGELLYRASQARSAEHVVRAIRDRGGKAAQWEADLADAATIPVLFDRAERQLGHVDVLVNNAAFCEPDTFVPQQRLAPEQRAANGVSPLLALTAHSHDLHFAVNSRAVALTTAEFARRHVARGASWGRIVNISTDGASGFAGEVSYGASKHALESYSRAAAAELGRYGITVNVVSLGAVQTGWITPELERSAAAGMPLGRIGTPEDAADAIVFFASEQARWITGQLLYVGGGHVMPM